MLREKLILNIKYDIASDIVNIKIDKWHVDCGTVKVTCVTCQIECVNKRYQWCNLHATGRRQDNLILEIDAYYYRKSVIEK